ncbi:hypothetical protein [Magnetococcus sp. PR-3]|uniref:hypothetical protein n=1 Tax=Magnetococcus sp. PR-3 TaxID=3120355 RepID=UPI002FCE3577
MAKREKTFSDVWYRVADLKLAIRPTVEIRKHHFRGQLWYVLQDPLSNRYYRLRPNVYRFVARLNPRQTVEEVWKTSLEVEPETAPGQEEVVRMLTQLHGADLLYYSTPTRAAAFFDRHEKRTQKVRQAKIKGFLFFLLPLINPDPFIKALLPYVRFLFSPFGALLWFGTMLYGGTLAAQNWQALAGDTEGVLAPDNLALLYGGFFLVKVLHELGHGVICRHFGGSVNTMGVMFLIFTPMPYVDATSSWKMRNRWQRVMVGSGGMLVEFFIGALAMVVWSQTEPGLLHSLAYNILFVTTVSTLLLNANPLMRLDGYYILSDLLDIPNLYSRARKELTYLGERFVLGNGRADSMARSTAEAFWLPLYGIGSALYRLVLFSGIALFVADAYLVLGVLIAFMVLTTSILIPWIKFIYFLFFSPRLVRTRLQALAVVGALTLVVGAGGASWPVADHVRLPGVVEAAHYVKVVNDAPGRLDKLLVEPNQTVTAHSALVSLSNPEFDLELQEVEAEYGQLQAMAQKAAHYDVEDLSTIRQRQQTLKAQILILEQSRAALAVEAKQAGIWVAPQVGRQLGSWLPRGSELGTIINPEQYHFSAVVSQAQAAAIFEHAITHAQIRISGQEHIALTAVPQPLIPYQHRYLPSPALGWFGGGDLPVRMDEAGNPVAMEDFFLLKATLDLPDHFVVHHGQLGHLRLELPPSPLFAQIKDRFLRFVQGRFQI